MTHECPAAGCTREVSIDMLMCRQHWYMVPGAIRTAVWNAWQDGAGAGTAQHTAAISSAIRSVNEKLAAKGITSGPAVTP
jgi:hypothetical protein